MAVAMVEKEAWHVGSLSAVLNRKVQGPVLADDARACHPVMKLELCLTETHRQRRRTLYTIAVRKAVTQFGCFRRVSETY